MFQAGQPFKPSAARENDVDKLLRDYRAGRLRFGSEPNERMPLGHVIAKNTTGADLAVGRPALHSGAWTNTETAFTRKDWDPRKGYLTLSATNYLRDGDQVGGIALTLEPIKQNEFGRVAIAGLAMWLQEPVGGFFVGEYICPSSTGFFSADFGYGRCVANFEGMSIVDLSESYLIAPYQISQAWNTTTKTVTASIGGSSFNFAGTWSTTIRDGYGSNAPFYQAYGTPAPQGLVRWVGRGKPSSWGAWHVVIPYC